MSARTRILLTAFLVSAAGLGAEDAHARTRVQYDKSGVPLSAPEEAVDRVAHHYENEAIKKLQALLARPRSADQEATLLARLAHLQQQRADILFRIAHASAYEAKRPIDLREYRRALSESTVTLSRLIEKYPTHRELPGAYLMRAKARRELEDREGAQRDFLFIEANFPTHPELKAACIELAEIAEESQEWKTAVKYLLMVLKQKRDSEHYPYALHRLAWAHYQLGNIDKSMAYVEVHTKFQNALIKRALLRRQPYSMHLSAREALLQDSALFFLKGLQLRLPNYTVDRAMPFLQRLVSKKESDPAFAGMVVRLTNLLRAEGLADELNRWKNDVVRTLPRREVSLQVLGIALEDHLNKYRYSQVNEAIDDLMRLHQTSEKLYSFQVAERMLLDAAGKLQEVISKDKDRSSAKEPTIALERVYVAYLGVARDDTQLARVHYNLGEALASLDRFDEAAVHYRWVFDQARGWDARKLGGVKPIEAASKALAIHYDSLKKRGVIPKDLKPRAVAPDVAAPDATLAAWMELVDRVDEAQGGAERSAQIDFFRLEANRALYAGGRVNDALARLDRFVRARTASAAATPSARLVVDTWIASERWREAEDAARAYGALAWPDAKFGAELQARAADFSFKIAEADFAAGNHVAVVAHGPEFLSRYPQSPRREDMVSLVARAAAKSGDEKSAGQYLSTIVDQMPTSKYFDKALVTRAEMAEKRHDYGAALRDYRQYLELPAPRRSLGDAQLLGMRRKILLLGWLDASAETLPNLLRDRGVCVEALAAHCDRYAAWVQIQGGSAPGRAIASARRGAAKVPAENEALWALRDLLAAGPAYGMDARIDKLQALSTRWNRIDPMFRYTLMPAMTRAASESFAAFRAQVKQGGRLRLDPKSIQRRVERIRKAEAAGAPVLKLPSVRAHVIVLNETASMYLDLASELVALDPPGAMSEEERQVFAATLQGVAAPFEKTARDLRSKAFELAANASVDAETFRSVADLYFAESPEAAAGRLPPGGYPSVAALEPGLVKDFAAELWGEAGADSPLLRLRGEWMSALDARHWARAAYALQEAQEKSLLDAGQLGLMRAASLTAVGARAEAVAELDAALPRLPEAGRARLRSLLARQYVSTLGRARVRELLKSGGEIPAELTGRERDLVVGWLQGDAS